MKIPEHRRWMINRLLTSRAGYTQEFINGVEEFDKFAKTQLVYLEDKTYRCPCALCQNTKFLTSDKVKVHIFRKGFMWGYWYWASHGEIEPVRHGVNDEFGSSSRMQIDDCGSNVNHYQTMVEDVMNCEQDTNINQQPNANAQSFYDMLDSLQ